MKTSNSECRRLFNNINTIHLELFLRKVHHMLITIDMKSDLAFIAINNNPVVLRKGLPRIIYMLSSSGISSITTSVKIVTLATTTGTSSQIPIGMVVDLSAICKDISVGVSLFKSTLLYKKKGITLTPAPKSHKVVFTYFLLMEQGIVGIP